MVGPNLIKQINQARILNILRIQGTTSRVEIARQLKLNRSTITTLTADLLRKKIIIDDVGFISTKSTGRPAIGIKLNPDGGYFIGVEISNESIRVVAINLLAKVLGDVSYSLDTKEPDKILDHAIDLIKKVWRETLNDSDKLLGVGMTIPGMLNRQNIIEYAARLEWRDVDIKSYLKNKLEVPAYIENDANAAALAEFYFGGFEVNDGLFYLLLDVGVGGGLVIDGYIYKGAFGTAGEVGHIRLPVKIGNPDELNSPMLEDYVGKNALFDIYHKYGGEGTNFDEFCLNLTNGETAATKAISQWGSLLAFGMVNIINIINPKYIILGGPLAKFLPHVKKPLAVLLEKDPFPGAKSVELMESRFHESGCVMGAAALAYESLFRVDGEQLSRGSLPANYSLK